MDRITFDFETGEIIFDTDAQKGTEIDFDLKEKRAAIMAAAGYEQINLKDFRKEINSMFRDMGYKGVVVAGSDQEDIAAAESNNESKEKTL